MERPFVFLGALAAIEHYRQFQRYGIAKKLLERH
jgi:hypothetical protein